MGNTSRTYLQNRNVDMKNKRLKTLVAIWFAVSSTIAFLIMFGIMSLLHKPLLYGLIFSGMMSICLPAILFILVYFKRKQRLANSRDEETKKPD